MDDVGGDVKVNRLGGVEFRSGGGVGDAGVDVKENRVGGDEFI